MVKVRQNTEQVQTHPRAGDQGLGGGELAEFCRPEFHQLGRLGGSLRQMIPAVRPPFP